MKKKCLSLLMAAMMMTTFALPAMAAEDVMVVSANDAATTAATGKIADIQKYGNLVLTIDPAELTEAGYAYGDLLLITVDGTDYSVPFGTNYSDVDTGNYVLRHVASSTGEGAGQLILAINMGDFATTNKIAEKKTDADNNVTWENTADGTAWKEIEVTIAMQEKEGYLDEYNIHQLKRTNNREDYASNAEFANFRNVSGGKLGKNALYRSSSPVDNQLERAAYADELSANAGIGAFINLANTKTEIDEFIAKSDFHSAYYEGLYHNGKVTALGLGVDFKADSFKKGMAEAIASIAAVEGPYLVHCTEGKDRAGFTTALIGMLMEVPAEEIISDYLVTYMNYYHIKATDEQYAAVRRSNIVPIIEQIAGVESGTDLSTVDLKEAAVKYLTEGGIDPDALDLAIEHLSTDYADPIYPLTQDSLFADNTNKNAYYYVPVTWGYIYDVTSGIDVTTYGVGQDMTRGDFVVQLKSAFGAKAAHADAHVFKDVTRAYQNDSVSWASANGYISGYSADTFGADDTITRGQAVTILYKMSGSPEVSADTKQFEDVTAADYYNNAVKWAVENKITSGTSDTTFSPNDPCKREQMITFLYKARKLVNAE